MYHPHVDNGQDILDSRDVDARIDELINEINEAEEEQELDLEVKGPDPDSVAELGVLIAFKEEGEQATCEWADGATLIRDSHFEDYARDFAEDIGAVNGDAGWPNNCIDWEQAARELQMDYTSAEFDGVTFWVR